MTEEFKEEKYRRELEEKQAKLDAALKEAEKVSQYRDIQAAVEAVDDVLNKLAVFNKISSEAELDQAMPELLESLGHYSISDRAYIFTWASSEQQILRMTHEWCAEGVSPTIDKMQELNINDMPNWTPKLKRGEAIVCADWDAEKSNVPEEYAIFDGQDIHSLIVIPIFANNKLNGYIGFDNPEQSRTALSVRLLSSIGGHISSLKDNFFIMAEQKKHNRVLSGLSVDYTIAFVLDLDTDDYEIIFSQQTNHAQIQKNITKFSDYVARYAKIYALPEFREAMKLELSSKTIKECFKARDDYHFSFETIPNAAGLSYFQAHIVKQYDEEHHYAFLGFRSVDEIIRKERFYKNALQKANQALQKQLDLITASLPGGVKISNDDQTYSFKYVSDQFANMLGYATPDELMEASGGSILGLAHPDDFDAGLADALDQYTRSDHYATTYRMKCKDGSWKYIEDRGNKIRAQDGTIEHWNLILDNDELMKKTIELEIEKKSNQSKSDFLSRMSHDMRTPLNGIIGLLDMCKKHPDDRQLVDSSRAKARIAADHLLSLINDILELSKLENKSIPLYKESFSVSELLHEVGIIAQMRGDEEGVTISFEGDIDNLKYSCLNGSPLYVKQILLNLITNGIKYNQENGLVYCCVEEEELSEKQVILKFEIRDTGIGMSQEFLPDIFKPFVQADNGPRSTYMGTGLGMAIVKNLLDRMNGTIQISSELGKGTIVNVAIPFEIADDRIVSKEEKQKETQTECRNIRVLLAEDNELNREIASYVLKDAGMKVTEAVDGQQALSVFLKKPEHYFDVILMDIMMPEMDGYAAARAIRNSSKADSKTIPIIAMTANAFDDDRRKSKAAGMDAHLSKPLDLQKLVETIEDFCNRSKES